MLKRVSITGPESTGKSWLAAVLSSVYNEPWVPEYARAYLKYIDRPYTFNDIVSIAKGQWNAEEKASAKAAEWLFCDTDFLVTRIWCLVKFGKSHPWIDHMLDAHPYHHYLLCNTDLPWEADPMREHPHLRKELFEMYLSELQSRKLPFTVISGNGNARMQIAVDALSLIS